MGHTNSTANLGLPQFIGTDKPTWLSDVNGAFSAIDTYAGTNDAALAITDAKADGAVNDAASALTTATNAANTAGTASTQATNAVTVAGNALTVANGINSKVGVLTDLTTTDKSTVVNAINEVNGKDAGDIAYDNTGSGLTATNVQAAIDEIAQGGGGSAYTVLAQSSSTGTNGAKLAELQTAFADLTLADFVRSAVIKDDNVVYHADAFTAGKYSLSRASNASAYVSETVTIVGTTSVYAMFNGTVTDETSTSDSSVFKLVKF